MDVDSLISILLEELTNMEVEALVKGSYGYGVPHTTSDIDVQIAIKQASDLEKLAQHFNSKVESVFFQDSTGNSYTSHSISFNRQGFRIDLIYDDDPNSFERVKRIVSKLKNLTVTEKNILRLVSGGYKYDRVDAYKIFLAIFDKYKRTLDKSLLKKIENGEQIDGDLASIIRSVVQILYVNEVDSSYKKYFLTPGKE
ncbi:MAG: hypothetical protein GWO41_00440 [candidate division Zixibacteria bacterium]|nr:hypothetical protein [candidate division Zixibacteria bacterium]NIW96756.1 hypothetical protein [Phycisphaerae bacterium]